MAPTVCYVGERPGPRIPRRCLDKAIERWTILFGKDAIGHRFRHNPRVQQTRSRSDLALKFAFLLKL
jgi:hypothetical protein